MILAAAESLADGLLRAGPVAAYRQAKARLDANPDARPRNTDPADRDTHAVAHAGAGAHAGAALTAQSMAGVMAHPRCADSRLGRPRAAYGCRA